MSEVSRKPTKRKLWWGIAALLPAILIATTYAFPKAVIEGLHTVHLTVPALLRQHANSRLIRALQVRAASGDCSAQYQLALQLHNRDFPHQYGIAMQGDARKWLIRSAECGSADGMTELGRYADEAGDYVEAFRWYMKAAELGDPYSEWMIGGYFEEGKGVRPDQEKALQWFKRAQYSGFHAESYIASLYAEKQDFIEAHDWYSRALEAADPFAAQELGRCYRDGDCRGFCDWRKPCPKDRYQAYVWLRVASLYGNCPDCYRQIAPSLSEWEIRKAETEAAAWVQKHPKRSEGL